MVKTIHAKFLRPLLLLICFVLFCCLCGCGNKADTATTGGGQQIASFTGAPSSLAVGHSSILTVKITDGTGAAVSGAIVNFAFVTNNSGGIVVALNGGTTDAGGQALAVYTAGPTTPSLSLEDTVQATCGSATGVLILTRTASSSSGYQITLSADVTSLTAGKSSIITATVTDASGIPASGQVVTFTKLIDQSTMGLITLGTGTTDANGKAIAVYTAGTNNPLTDVQDTIEASVSAGASYEAVVITRTSTVNIVTPGYNMTLTADITSLAAGQHSILTATVKDGSGNTAGGLPVTFAFVNNNSSAPALSVVSGTTDAAGRISTIYTAGSGSSATSVQDTIGATVSSGGYSSTGAVIITRTAASTVPAGYVITVTPTPASLAAGAMSVLIAQVYNPDSTPASGQAVTFSFVINNSGAPALSIVNGTTDASGRAIAVYTAGNNSPGLSVSDAVSASLASGEANAAIITRLPAVGTGNRIISFTQTPQTAYPSPRIQPPDHYVQMKVKVTTDDRTTPVVGKEVSFYIIIGDGTIFDSNYNTASEGDPPLTVITDNNGEAWVTFQRPEVGLGDTVVRAQIEGTTNGGDAASIVYWKGLMPSLKLEAAPASVVVGGTSTITATVTDDTGIAIINAPVTFALTVNNSGAPALVVINANTDSNGKAVAVYTAGATPATDSVSATTSYLGFGAGDSVSISVTAPTP